MSNLTNSVLTGHCTGARSFVRHEPTRKDTPQLPVPHRRRWRGRRTRLLFSFLRGGQRRRRIVDEWRMTLARGRGSISNPSSNNFKKPNSGGGCDDDDDDERGDRRPGIMLRRLPPPADSAVGASYNSVGLTDTPPLRTLCAAGEMAMGEKIRRCLLHKCTACIPKFTLAPEIKLRYDDC